MKISRNALLSFDRAGTVHGFVWLLLFLGLGASPLSLPAQPRANRPPPQFLQKAKTDQEEGRRILGQFRQAGLAGAYWIEFELAVMPHQAATRTLRGHLLGSRNNRGPVSRLVLDPGGDPSLKTTRWLLQSGTEPEAWRCEGVGDAVRSLTGADWFEPVAQTDLSPFDLQMPFLYWDDFVFEGVAKVRGRMAHSFILYPPASLATEHPALYGVRMLLDIEFNALLQAELLGQGGKPSKIITILGIKKIDGKWIMKSVDVRNELTRGKTRFTVTAAALELTLPADFFEPGRLSSGSEPVVPPEVRIQF
ncbi:MAG: outer membrane lipoprotein-sorting protein [Opitutaceae bacterium]|nr:outer membrane lipoprotein-sorting protein [Opitutaceae bacterium]